MNYYLVNAEEREDPNEQMQMLVEEALLNHEMTGRLGVRNPAADRAMEDLRQALAKAQQAYRDLRTVLMRL